MDKEKTENSIIQEKQSKVQIQIKHSILEMTDPYVQHSQLYNSLFHGYYSLIFIFSVYFILVFPLINYIHKGSFLDYTVIKLMKTNLKWDLISFIIFTTLALLFMARNKVTNCSKKIMVIIYCICFMGIGYLIVDSFEMYFTDRIFIVTLSWAFGLKIISYQLDHSQIPSESFSFKMQYLISPMAVYSTFKQQHNKNLPIHKLYLLKKFIISTFCLLANNILLLQFIDPLCNNSQQLSFLALFFKLIPYTFYMQIIMYYMVMENIIGALSQLSQIQNRKFYQDWWNSQTIYQFIGKWVTNLNQFNQKYFPKLSQKIRQSINVSVILILLLQVFGRGINTQSILFFGAIVGGFYLIGDIPSIQNNYLVHLITITFTPLLVAFQCKYQVFV